MPDHVGEAAGGGGDQGRAGQHRLDRDLAHPLVQRRDRSGRGAPPGGHHLRVRHVVADHRARRGRRGVGAAGAEADQGRRGSGAGPAVDQLPVRVEQHPDPLVRAERADEEQIVAGRQPLRPGCVPGQRVEAVRHQAGDHLDRQVAGQVRLGQRLGDRGGDRGERVDAAVPMRVQAGGQDQRAGAAVLNGCAAHAPGQARAGARPAVAGEGLADAGEPEVVRGVHVRAAEPGPAQRQVAVHQPVVAVHHVEVLGTQQPGDVGGGQRVRHGRVERLARVLVQPRDERVRDAADAMNPYPRNRLLILTLRRRQGEHRDLVAAPDQLLAAGRDAALETADDRGVEVGQMQDLHDRSFMIGQPSGG